MRRAGVVLASTLLVVSASRATCQQPSETRATAEAAIRAADASRTQILGNFRIDYSRKPISCPNYPWYDRIFMRSHIEIECDPAVWQRVEELIRIQLPASIASQASAP